MPVSSSRSSPIICAAPFPRVCLGSRGLPEAVLYLSVLEHAQNSALHVAGKAKKVQDKPQRVVATSLYLGKN